MMFLGDILKRHWQEIGLAWHIFLTRVGQFYFIMVGLFYFIIDRWVNRTHYNIQA